MNGAFQLEISLPATRDKVWRYLTDEHALLTWFWPASLEADCQLEPEPGGFWRIASEKGGMAVYGYFLEFGPNSRYQTTWSWEGEEAETQVELALTESGPDQARLTLVHSGHDSQEALDSHRAGWNDCLARLQERLERIAAAKISTEQDILDLVGESMERGYLLLDESELSPEFFDLSSGLLGELFQKFTNYRLRLAIVLPEPARHGERMAELAHEHSRHASLRFFSSEAAAENWLEQSG